MLTLFIFLVLLILIMIDLPIAVAMGLTAIAFFVGLGNEAFLTMLPQRIHYWRYPSSYWQAIS
jgi:C4-dicarboxylate transporter, DctM subunit